MLAGEQKGAFHGKINVCLFLQPGKSGLITADKREMEMKMRQLEKSNNPSGSRLLGLLAFSLVFLFGCVGGRTLVVDIEYDATRTPPPPFTQTGKMKILLLPFEKGPGVSDDFGKWTGFRGKEDIIKSAAPVDDAVTNAVFAYLKKAGFDVTLALKGTTMESRPSTAPDVVIGGTVQRISTMAKSGFGSTEIKNDLTLNVILKNVKDGSLVTENIDGTSEPKTIVAFDREAFKNAMDNVLSESVERIFTNVVLKDGLLRPSA